ncbi:hypothetical protein BZA70DRAFT_141750 [Myxozyma melibiosi]|uniref:RNA-binding S4 domain-containing protein n=1 Tax=Myxozyma melibiosi TaxID=54550 RepID=A0ABR1F7F0_9ASCO
MPKKPSVPLKSLVRGLVRSSWHKQNFYNLAKKDDLYLAPFSEYKQRWLSKRESRAYHGDHITEHQWQGVFNPHLKSVANFNNDNPGQSTAETPIAMDLFTPLERRLDVAVFRAMFASSPKQARQFVAQGKVKVNGRRMQYCRYPLRPGDVFQVEPDCVLRAVGREKPSQEKSELVDEQQRENFRQFLAYCEEDAEDAFNEKFQPMPVDGLMDGDALYRKCRLTAIETLKKRIAEMEAEDFDRSIYEESAVSGLLTAFEEFKASNKESDTSTDDTSTAEVTPPSHIETDSLKEAYKKVFSAKAVNQDSNEFKELVKHFIEVEHGFAIAESQELLSEFLAPSSQFTPHWWYVYKKEFTGLDLPWQEGPYGLEDPDKPYFTPWTPRPFLAPFAILPHHIEISFKSCSAVYMRDPVIREGHSEVISPISLEAHQNAYRFYVRRRK